MGVDMLAAVLAVKIDLATATAPEPDFDAGHRALARVTDADQFNFDDVEEQLADILGAYYPASGVPHLETLKRAGTVIIHRAQEAIASRLTTAMEIGGYWVYLSGGRSSGGAPTDECEAIHWTDCLPRTVMEAMGFVWDFSIPRGTQRAVTGEPADGDIVDAIALRLGTRSDWNGADQLMHVDELIGQVRQQPGGADPALYLAQWTRAYGDPRDSTLLSKQIGAESHGEDA